MLQRRSAGPTFADCLTIKEAAEFLRVTPETLRNWDRRGKFKPLRHPINGYRLYPRAQLQELLEQATSAGAAPRAAGE